jgi:hypothetical protein
MFGKYFSLLAAIRFQAFFQLYIALRREKIHKRGQKGYLKRAILENTWKNSHNIVG